MFLKFCINDLNRFLIILVFFFYFMDKMNKEKEGRRREKLLSREKSKFIYIYIYIYIYNKLVPLNRDRIGGNISLVLSSFFSLHSQEK